MEPSKIKAGKRYANASGNVRHVIKVSLEKEDHKRSVRYTTVNNPAGGVCNLLRFARWAQEEA